MLQTPEIVIKSTTLLARWLPVNYGRYLQSGAWRKKADTCKKRAGYRCQTCNRSNKQVRLEAHHRTYERLGYEIPEDLICLCRDCHKAVTDVRRTIAIVRFYRPIRTPL